MRRIIATLAVIFGFVMLGASTASAAESVPTMQAPNVYATYSFSYYNKVPVTTVTAFDGTQWVTLSGVNVIGNAKNRHYGLSKKLLRLENTQSFVSGFASYMSSDGKINISHQWDGTGRIPLHTKLTFGGTTYVVSLSYLSVGIYDSGRPAQTYGIKGGCDTSCTSMK